MKQIITNFLPSESSSVVVVGLAWALVRGAKIDNEIEGDDERLDGRRRKEADQRRI